jgi:hypothetical protein
LPQCCAERLAFPLRSPKDPANSAFFGLQPFEMVLSGRLTTNSRPIWSFNLGIILPFGFESTIKKNWKFARSRRKEREQALTGYRIYSWMNSFQGPKVNPG